MKVQPYCELLESTMCQDPHLTDRISGRVSRSWHQNRA